MTEGLVAAWFAEAFFKGELMQPMEIWGVFLGLAVAGVAFWSLFKLDK